MADGLLAGVRVLEFSIVYAAPWCGVHLADMGAEVTKVEPPEGDSTRHSGAVVPGAGKAFSWLNRGKRSLVLDLHDPRGLEVVERMVPDIDVVVANYRPGVTKRLGIDYEALAAIRPDLIYAEISAFGEGGPLAGRGGSDIIAQSYGGATAGVGKVDQYGAPQTMNIALGDLTSGLGAAGAILGALYHREKTGEGQRISLSLLRSVMAISGWMNMRDPVTDAVRWAPMIEEMHRVRDAGGSYPEILAVRNATAGRIGHGLYYGGYAAKDGGISLGAATPATRDAIRRVLGLEGEDSDSNPNYNAADPKNQQRMADFYERTREIMHTKTVAEWMEIFDAAEVPAAPVRFPEDIADDPQASTMMVDIEHETAGRQRMIGPILEMSKTPLAPAGPAPVLGRHTRETLAGLGYREEEIAALYDEGVVA